MKKEGVYYRKKLPQKVKKKERKKKVKWQDQRVTEGQKQVPQ